MTSEPPRSAPPAPKAVAQALELLLGSMEENEPIGDEEDQDTESKMTRFNRLAWRYKAAGEALQLAAQTRAAHFHRRRNALLPIHRLPSELLSAILIKSVRECDYLRTDSLKVLAQVAWQWWQAVKSDPQFWTHITPPMGGVELQIRKAGILPLRLDWSSSVHGPDCDAFKDLLQRHAERWTSIDLKGFYEDVAIQTLCAGYFPRLEYLRVRGTSREMSGDWRFNLAQFHNLREARLPIMPSFSVSPTPNSPILLRILHLDFHSRNSHYSYDLESLLGYIPQLTELAVENIYNDTSPPSPVDAPIISLPMLRYLRVSNVVLGNPRDGIPLLARIRAPLLEQFDLRYQTDRWARAMDVGGRTIFDELVTRPLASLSRPEDAPIYSILGKADRAASWTVDISEVDVWGQGVWITAEGNGGKGLCVHCSTKDYIPTYILLPLTRFSLPVDLSVALWDTEKELSFWDDVLDATPLLRSCALDCALQVAQQVMDLLSTKVPSPSSTNPRAPLLEKLCFRFQYVEGSWSEGDVGEAVKAMLKRRSDLFIQGSVLDPPKLVVTGPNGLVYDEVECCWLDPKDVTRRL